MLAAVSDLVTEQSLLTEKSRIASSWDFPEEKASYCQSLPDFVSDYLRHQFGKIHQVILELPHEKLQKFTFRTGSAPIFIYNRLSLQIDSLNGTTVAQSAEIRSLTDIIGSLNDTKSAEINSLNADISSLRNDMKALKSLLKNSIGSEGFEFTRNGVQKIKLAPTQIGEKRFYLSVEEG